MALIRRIPFSSCSSSSHFGKSCPVNPHPICSVHYTSSSSPFTEKHSLEHYQRDGWLYKAQLEHASLFPLPPDSNSARENDIVVQLPELKKPFRVLREKRENGGSDGRKKGPGNVFLVGTGPGDPELLTLKAVRVIESADLLLYDRLVSNDVLNLVGPNARLLYVGKTVE